MEPMIKPVYIKNSELQTDKSSKITDYELYESIHNKVGDTIHCIQLERDLWRIYLKSSDSRTTLVHEGFEIRSISAQVYDSNPYSTRAKNPKDVVLKITISGLPLSVDDSAIAEMLNSFDVYVKSEIKYEHIRHPVTHRMTSVLNGNRFLYIAPLSNNRSLPRNVTCAGLKCRLYHYGQNTGDKMQCYNCWGSGHKASVCKNEKCCRVCLQPGHVPGSCDCPYYVESNSTVIPFHGSDDPISNFYPCEIKVFGETHQSSEHAYQLTKALRAGNLEIADKIRNANTALEAKRFGNTVKEATEWDTQKLEVMEEIISEKAEQVKPFREQLEKSDNNTIFAEATVDAYWGTGLDSNATEHTDPNKWPGTNKLGLIVRKTSLKYRRKLRSLSVPRQNQQSADNIQTLDKFLNDAKKKKQAKKDGKKS
jgi:ribA/ribD-fused uncharacterized protein